MVGWKAALATVLGVVAGLVAPLAAPATAQTQAQSTIVSDNPANWTPNVLDGKVEAIIQVGSRIIAGGIFTQVQAADQTGPILSRSNIFAFDATTGAIDTTFAPVFDDEVTSLVASSDGQSIFVGGAFSTVNGATARKVAKISASTGAKDATYSGGTNGRVNDMALSRGRLIVAGQFSTVKSVARAEIASLDPTTGDVTSDVTDSFAGIHNPSARGGAAASAITKFAVDPAGNKLVAIGNFTSVDGVARDQVAMLDISAAPSTLANWYTTEYTSTCSNTFTTYMRDLDISPDGSYIVISTTGAYNGSTSGCDVISRYEMGASGTNLQSTWRDYTGGDTTYAVAVTGTAVYVGGHFRWMNNAFAADKAGPGAVAREGIAALDPANGLPFSWNPGRAPDRGVGVFDLLATATGLWVGDDTDRIDEELRQRIAFMPLDGGTTPPQNTTGTLPTDAYLLGGTDPSVLYRIDAGGPELPSLDDGPNWLADTATTSSFRTTGSTAASFTAITSVDSTVPNTPADRVPSSIFATNRTDPTTTPEMNWSFPVTTGTPVTVRLYFANRTSSRIFAVDIDGVNKLNNFNLSTTPGNNIGTMRSFDVTSDGSVDINFRHQTGDPLISGIEIINRDLVAGGSASAGQVQTAHYTGSGAPTGHVTTPGTEPWGQSRGAFQTDSTLFTGEADGTFTARSFDGVTFGAPSSIDLLLGAFATDLPNVTGMFYDSGRLYFTLANDTNLYYRYFTPESRVVGGVRYNATGDLTAMGPQRVAGMFKSGNTVYLADKTDGHLYSVSFSGGVVTGPATMVDASMDWRARGIFLRSGLLPNVPPVAHASAAPCDANVCAFDGSSSTDSDGTVVSYAWNFGDGGTDTGSSVSHAYGAGGAYTATLTVTDDRGGTATDTVVVNPSDPPNQAPIAAFTTSCINLTCTVVGSGSTDSDGVVASYAWDFGDGNTDTGVTATHAYAGDGTDTITLVVTDDDGAASAPVSHDVSVTSPPTSTIAFRGSATFSGSAAISKVTVPASVQSGDALLLFVTTNSATAVNSPPAGWSLAGTRTSGTDTRTLLYTKVATGSDASTAASVTFAAGTKSDLTVLAYSGTAADPIEALASSGETVNRAGHTTPAVTVPIAGSWVVNYWADKSAATTSWTDPAPQVIRSTSAGTGSGRITSISSDLGTSSPAGATSGITATASSLSAKATMWSIVLKAADAPNQVPVASFTTHCAFRTCTVDGSDSFDIDGTVAAYAWDFGDGSTDTGATSTHTYGADGTFTVQLVVTDDDGANSPPVGHDVAVAAAPVINVVFHASATFSGTAATQRVAVPMAVQAGDTMLLFVTTNTLTAVSTPAGWSFISSQQSNTDTQTSLYSKTAAASDPGTNASVTFAAATKGDLTLLAYGGTAASAIEAVASAGETVAQSAHLTPGVTVLADRSLVVSYWADKSAATTSWTEPAGQVRRSASAGTGSGHLTSLATDLGAPSPAGSSIGLTALANSSSSKATMWSVVLQAAS